MQIDGWLAGWLAGWIGSWTFKSVWSWRQQASWRHAFHINSQQQHFHLAYEAFAWQGHGSDHHSAKDICTKHSTESERTHSHSSYLEVSSSKLRKCMRVNITRQLSCWERVWFILVSDSNQPSFNVLMPPPCHTFIFITTLKVISPVYL